MSCEPPRVSFRQPDPSTTEPSTTEVESLDPPRHVFLVSEAGTEFEITDKACKLSELLSAMLESDKTATRLPLPTISDHILREIVVYLKYHNGVNPGKPDFPLRSRIMTQLCPGHPSDAELVDRGWPSNKQFLYDLVSACNYMGIDSLLHLGCAKIASAIKGAPKRKHEAILDPANPHIANEADFNKAFPDLADPQPGDEEEDKPEVVEIHGPGSEDFETEESFQDSDDEDEAQEQKEN